MATVTIRANQNSYNFDQTGGTRDPQFELQDRVPFMDAIEAQRTEVLKTLTKGGALNEVRPKWGIHKVTPRSSVLAAQLTAGASSMTLPSGHTARFQQGHVVQLTRQSDGETETVWINDDPALTTATIDRGIGSTAIQFEIGDQVKVVGIAMPQGSDFPLAPVSRGEQYSNEWQEFSKSIVHTHQSDITPSVDNPTGSLKDRDMLQIGREIKMDLDRALLLGRKKKGDPSAAAPKPSFMGGLIQMAELSGNVYTVGGPSVLLSPEAIAFVQHEITARYEDRGGQVWLMSWNTKQILNKVLSPLRYNRGIDGTEFDDRWESYRTEVGTVKFTWDEDFPDGIILGYSPKNIKYHPLQGADWKEKDFPTKGLYSWQGMAGIYTLKAMDVPGMFLMKGFDTNTAHYPSVLRPSTFLT